jgi:hypothetical protein
MVCPTYGIRMTGTDLYLRVRATGKITLEDGIDATRFDHHSDAKDIFRLLPFGDRGLYHVHEIKPREA